MNRHIVLFLAVLSALIQLSCKHKAPAGVVAEVNGHAITTKELDKIYSTQYPQPVEESNDDQVMAQKLDLLGRLITNEIMWQQAEKLGLTATDADSDTEVNKSRAPYPKDEHDKQLADRHMPMDDLRRQLCRGLTVNQRINRESTSLI